MSEVKLWVVDEVEYSDTLLLIAGYDLEKINVAKEIFERLGIDSSGIARMIIHRKKLDEMLRGPEMRIEWKNKKFRIAGTERHAYLSTSAAAKTEVMICTKETDNFYNNKVSNSHYMTGGKCKKCAAGVKTLESGGVSLTIVDMGGTKDFNPNTAVPVKKKSAKKQ